MHDSDMTSHPVVSECWDRQKHCVGGLGLAWFALQIEQCLMGSVPDSGFETAIKSGVGSDSAASQYITFALWMIPGSGLPLPIQMLVRTCAVPWPDAVFNSVIRLLFVHDGGARPTRTKECPAGAVQLRMAVMHPCAWPIACFAHVLSNDIALVRVLASTLPVFSATLPGALADPWSSHWEAALLGWPEALVETCGLSWL